MILRGFILEKASIHDMRFHDPPRTVGSWLAGSGESVQLIGKVLNRCDVERNASKMLMDPASPCVLTYCAICQMVAPQT